MIEKLYYVGDKNLYVLVDEMKKEGRFLWLYKKNNLITHIDLKLSYLDYRTTIGDVVYFQIRRRVNHER